MSPPGMDVDAVARRLAEIAAEAGALLRRMQGGGLAHSLKSDGSPTSAADLAAEHLILERLREGWPDLPVIAEETASSRRCGTSFFLVDPLDGTRDYLRSGPDYSVNLALVEGSRPVAAALACPGRGRLWAAGTGAATATLTEDGAALAWLPARVRAAPARGLTALVSARHPHPGEEACLRALPVRERKAFSSALKFGLIASGEADLYLRFGPTMEWDTAAGDHIVSCAGGCVVAAEGGPIAYGREERLYRNGPFAVMGDPAIARRIDMPR
jgi:3'(2'), 5'-bisphosphate nucleotidase